MRKNKNSINSKITNKNLKIAIGTCICLISIFCLLNFGYVSGFIFWCVSFFVGSLYAYIFYVLLFLYGLKFIFQKKFTVRNFNLLIIGLSILTVGVLAITTNQINYFDGEALNFQNFKDAFIKSLNLENFPKLDINQSGGILGLTLTAVLNSAFTTLGTTIFSGILIGAGTLLLLARPFIYLIKSFKADKSDISLNEQAIIDFKDNENLLGDEITLSRIGSNEFDETDENSSSLVGSAFTSVSDEETEEVVSSEEKVEPAIESFVPSEPLESDNIGGLQRVKFNPSFNSNEVKEESKTQLNEEPLNNIGVKPLNSVTPLASVPVIEEEPESADTIEENDDYEEDNSYSNTLNIQSQLDFDNQLEENDSTDDLEFTSDFEEPVSSLEETETLRPVANLNVPKEEVSEVPQTVNEPKVQQEDEVIDGVFVKLPKNYKHYVAPSIDLLDESQSNEEVESKNIAVCDERKDKINDLLQDFKIGAKIVSYKIGPSVTRYDLETDRTVSIQGFEKYMNDIAKRLGGMEARFVPIIQGKTTSGIEIANENRALISFREIFSHLPAKKPGVLEIPFGVNISGDYISSNLAEFPHMLVCGTTGSGKSIYMHSVILSLILRNSMDEIRFIMVDPKCVEFSNYAKIPHLLCPIITEPAEANAALAKLVDEMEERFRIFSSAGVRDITSFNKICVKNNYKKMPYIILVIDEFADLIEQNKQIGQPISRLGSKARAAGIHMIIATQRPSTDVLTGTIKANLSVRVALMTSSTTDSIVALGEGGAEKLLGHGDMLVNCQFVSKQEKTRVQGCFVSNEELNRVTKYLESQYPQQFDERYVNLLEKSRLEATDLGTIHNESGEDNAYEMVKEYIMSNKDTCSISFISKKFHFGFNRSSEIFNKLIDEHILEKPEYSNSAKGAKVMVHLSGYKDPNAEPITPGSYSQSTFKAD